MIFEAGQSGDERLFSGAYQNFLLFMNTFVQTVTKNLTVEIPLDLPLKIPSKRIFLIKWKDVL